ncbi:hypothetical protein C9374_005848 [Naegleria lovaniensis]|uniref:Endo-beta-1,2-glucanase SGL domain-containing protein n=1 Tax=Naegleria lovaniensis TaxID=51637 RepID=A0AA88KN09_NAELO|nr:uncharacterized protein C9374_005848 [Naegleria lovaniensis]KAG2382056.1 hypothetical protein C9374_005848 [Naegleria lovaniensis]
MLQDCDDLQRRKVDNHDTGEMSWQSNDSSCMNNSLHSKEERNDEFQNFISYFPVPNFAKYFSLDDFVKDDDTKIENFINSVAFWEGRFANANGVGLNCATGLTYDGHQIDHSTSDIHDPLHEFSSPAKEALHLNMIALALDGNPTARLFFEHSQIIIEKLVNENGKRASTESLLPMKLHLTPNTETYLLDLLERKFDSYETFDKKYPGFGSLLPWFKVKDDGADPQPDWASRIPSLDNGQFIWSLLALEHVLMNTSNFLSENVANQQNILRRQALATRILEKIKKIKKTTVTMFYHGDGKVRAIAYIKDIYGDPLNASNYKGNGKSFINDPYEGEMMTTFMALMCRWKEMGYDEEEGEKIWKFKQSKLKRTIYKSKLFGDIPVEEGYWYSSHEKWKYLVLPYLDSDINRRVFMNGEKARLIHSIENNIPGLFASVTKPTTHGRYYPKYASECGIPSISCQKVLFENIVTPYASFPTILAHRNVGLAWYWMMLKGSKMQGLYGSTESITANGKKICPVLTWDSKITTVVAICGGVSKFTREFMKKQGLYDKFISTINREWGAVFNDGNEQNEFNDSQFTATEDISFTKLLPQKFLPKSPREFDFVQTTKSEKENGKSKKIK